MSDIQGYTSELLILNHNSRGDSSYIIANSIISKLLKVLLCCLYVQYDLSHGIV